MVSFVIFVPIFLHHPHQKSSSSHGPQPPQPPSPSLAEVHKLVTPSSWALLYESVTEELCLRAKCAAHALCVPWMREGIREGMREGMREWLGDWVGDFCFLNGRNIWKNQWLQQKLWWNDMDLKAMKVGVQKSWLLVIDEWDQIDLISPGFFLFFGPLSPLSRSEP